MRKLLLALALLLMPLLVPSVVSAQLNPLDQVCIDAEADGETPVACQTTGNNPISGEDGVIMRVVEILSFVVGVASVIMIIFGGLKYVTSQGNGESTASAKNTILYALIGVVLFLFSQVIIRFVLTRF